jgi:hypothetical protein
MKGTSRHSLSFPKELDEALDDWRAKQRPIPDFTTAVIQLLKIALSKG